MKTKMFGMTVAKRETFIIDPAGKLVKHYSDVNPDVHSQQVLTDLQQLVGGGTRQN